MNTAERSKEAKAGNPEKHRGGGEGEEGRGREREGKEGAVQFRSSGRRLSLSPSPPAALTPRLRHAPALTAPRARPRCPARLRPRPAPRGGGGASALPRSHWAAPPTAPPPPVSIGRSAGPSPPRPRLVFIPPRRARRRGAGSRRSGRRPLPSPSPGALWDSGGPARQRPLLPPPPQLLLHPQVQDGGGGGSSGPIPAAPCPGGPALPGLLAQLRRCLLLPRALRGPAGPARAALPRAGARPAAAAGARRPG